MILFLKGLMVQAGVSAVEKTLLIFINKNVKFNVKTYHHKMLAKNVPLWKQNNPNRIFQ